MELREHAQFALNQSRMIAEGLLADFKTREDWLYQSHPKANHAMWIAGHLALADNMFGSKFREEAAHKPEGWDELFWFGSELKTDTSVYPKQEEVLAYYRDRRETLLKILEELSDEELDAPAPPEGEQGPIAGAPCIGHAFLFIAYHEGIHTGQLTIAHRGLGNQPMFSPQPTEQQAGV